MAEVMAAVIMLALLVTSLSVGLQRACDGVLRLRDRANELSVTRANGDTADAYAWGARVSRTDWFAGPVLVIRLADRESPETLAGVWADGWWVGEWPISDDASVSLGADIWQGMTGSELIVRARADEGAWGPPYRTLVPDSYGNVTEMDGESAESGGAEEPHTGFDDLGTAMHVRWRGVPTVSASWTGSPFVEDSQDAVFILATGAGGLRELEVYGSTQRWVESEGRGLDVFW